MLLRGLLATASVWVIAAVGLRTLLVAPEVCPAVTPDSARAAAHEAGQWIARGQRQDGSYTYEYNRDTASYLADYNVVRHAGVTMSLYQLVAEGEADMLAVADRGLGYMEASLVRRAGRAAFRDPASGRVQLGASALMLMSLAERREATGDSRYDGLMREVARFLIVLQRPDGSFLNLWDPNTGAPYPGETSKYATGEAFWALAKMHRFFPGEGWDKPVRLVADYLSLHRDRVERNKFPPWADQWAAYGLGEVSAWPGGPALSADNIAYAESLAGRFGFLVRVESRRTDAWLSKTAHGRRARAAGMGTWGEGLGGLYQLATNDPRFTHLRPAIRDRAICVAGMLVDRQQDQADAAADPNPRSVQGAWFTEGATRMDDQQHAISALLLAAAIIEAEGEHGASRGGNKAP